jgi:hypothetical protein
VSVGHYENFPVASRLVPAALRPAVVAIYRFARSADDIADEGDASDAQRLAALASYDAALDAIARGDTPSTLRFPTSRRRSARTIADRPLPRVDLGVPAGRDDQALRDVRDVRRLLRALGQSRGAVAACALPPASR